MAKFHAIFITKNGREKRITGREAHAMLRHGEVEMVRRRPLVVRQLRFPIYEEEQAYLCGHLVNGINREAMESQKDKSMGLKRTPWKGRSGAPKFRCRPPRKPRRADEDAAARYLAARRRKAGYEGERIAEEVMRRRKAS